MKVTIGLNFGNEPEVAGLSLKSCTFSGKNGLAGPEG
jgi:hypothetical protein